MRKWGIGAGALLVVLTFACLLGVLILQFGGGTLIPIASSPEAMTQRLYDCRDGSTRAPHVLATRQWERGAVILYKAPCEPPQERLADSDRDLGYSLVVRGLLSRKVEIGEPLGKAELVECGVGGHGDEFPALVYGRVKDTRRVVGVEALTDAGHRLRDEAQDSFFAVVAPDGQDLRELKVLGRDGQVLERLEVMPHLGSHYCF